MLMYTILAISIVIIFSIIGLTVVVTNKAYAHKEIIDPLPEVRPSYDILNTEKTNKKSSENIK